RRFYPCFFPDRILCKAELFFQQSSHPNRREAGGIPRNDAMADFHPVGAVLLRTTPPFFGKGDAMRAGWFPKAMRVAPQLDEAIQPGPVKSRFALLLNPFYAKDPHASFGKHVLTPTLALTSVAAGTPAGWEVRYWDENLLQGPPPWQPFPQVVGITVHLTFAERAYALARWYRRRGAKVVFGGLHVISCPDEVRPHADAIVIGEGVHT